MRPLTQAPGPTLRVGASRPPTGCNHGGAPRVLDPYDKPGVDVDEERRRVFDEFARARMPELLRFGHALTGSPHAAADLVQDALERTMIAWPRVEQQGDPEGYVRRIMVNRNISIWRRRRREHLILDATDDDGRQQVTVAAAEPMMRDFALWESVKALPPRQRTVIVLRYYEDMSEAQIASVMGSSVGTVKSQASRALASLRKASPAYVASDVIDNADAVDERGRP
jgi:RNA polymerase sigma-70 factor (sigma-E family)